MTASVDVDDAFLSYLNIRGGSCFVTSFRLFPPERLRLTTLTVPGGDPADLRGPRYVRMRRCRPRQHRMAWRRA